MLSIGHSWYVIQLGTNFYPGGFRLDTASTLFSCVPTVRLDIAKFFQELAKLIEHMAFVYFLKVL